MIFIGFLKKYSKNFIFMLYIQKFFVKVQLSGFRMMNGVRLNNVKRGVKINIVLIGMPAVGKTTVGRILAKKLGYGFIDTDILIQNGEKMTLARIIATHGIEKFLEIEADYLAGLDCSGTIIATGGSAVYKERAMACLKKNSMVIYLKIDLPCLASRLSDLSSRGVAIGPKQDLSGLYLERTRLYERYQDICIACDTLSPDQVAGAIVEKVPEYLRSTRDVNDVTIS